MLGATRRVAAAALERHLNHVGEVCDDIAATLDHIRSDPGCTGRAGAVGFCLGGQLAWLTATRTNADAAVSYYGVGLEGLVGESPALRKPVMLHIAEADGFVPPAAQAAIRQALASQALAMIHGYPGRDRCSRPTRSRYLREQVEWFQRSLAALCCNRGYRQ